MPSPDGSFRTRVIAIVRRIPRGRVATYGDVAALAGHPRAWRAVGSIMRTCGIPSVPCHRVVGAGGRLGGYSDPLRKRQLLQQEGLVVGRRTIHQFDAIRWKASRSEGR
jgi:O-6-methylguanine DNA methyltransferase